MSNAKLHRNDLKPKLIALSVAACFGVSATHSLANPTGGTVTSGSATFATSGNTLTITNSANAIINWQNFSIGVNEITRFLQSSGSSAVLNRVVGANGVIPQSVIDGILSSNGRVFLLNPSGIAISSTGRVDVAGFIASSLNLSDSDFLAKKMRFTGVPGAGAVTNAGRIDTSAAGPGGQVWLVGPDVQNSGVIRSPQGEIILAAGKSVELVSENSPFVTVNITADSEQALNVGQLLADSGRIGMFGALVRQGGVAQANSAVAGANGEIRLVATKDLTLDAGSVTTANGPSGGNVTLQAQGGTNLVYGTVEAKGSSGQGGTIEALGVRVGVLGNGIIDASGDAGGGTVLVGGDQHGANPNIQNAQQTLIGPDGVIRADASTTGDGGRVIVWSDVYTQVYGSVSARGGAQSGNGGFIETSSGAGMDMTGVRIDTRAPNGKGGTWLIDPLDVVFEPNTYAGGYAFAGGTLGFASNPGQVLHITEGTIEGNFLYGGTISIQATRNVLFDTNLNLVYASVTGSNGQQTFEVRAVNNIDLAADGVVHSITTNGQNVTLSANDNGNPQLPAGLNQATGTGSILGGGTITTNGGNVLLSGYGIKVGAVTTSVVTPTIPALAAGNVTMLSYGADIVTGSISTHATTPPNGAGASPGGYVTLSTTYGNILVNGAIDTRGADGFNSRSSNSGTDGGTVSLVRTSQTTPGTITVTGDIITSAGAGVPGTAQGTGVGNGGNAGGVFLYGGNSPASGQPLAAYGNIIVNGSITARGGNGAAGIQAYAAGLGGLGGTVLLYGDAGHSVTLSNASGIVDVSGGAGGIGAAAYSVSGTGYAGGLGGRGGSGGLIQIFGGSIVVNGSLTAKGGAGGNGGDGSSASVTLLGGDGGAGGNGGGVQLGSSIIPANSISVTGAIVADGGRAGNGGAFGGNGGDNEATQGGFGGSVNAYGISTVALGSVSVNGGAGGNGAGGNVITYASSTGLFVELGNGGSGSNNAGGISITGGTITTGALSANGGAGGTGASNLDAFVYGVTVTTTAEGLVGAGFGGGGGSGGSVNLTSTGAITAGAISVSGGAGGAAGTSDKLQVLTTSTLQALSEAQLGGGGSGGRGGTVFVTSGGDVSIQSIAASGGAGGAGSNGGNVTATATSTGNSATADASIGQGGNGNSAFNDGSAVTITTSGNISIGSISATGGAGGAGGNANSATATATSNANSASAEVDVAQGGSGGTAGDVTVNSTAYGNISIGSIIATGGGGGAGGTNSAFANATTTASAYSADASIFFDSVGIGSPGGRVGVSSVYGNISIPGGIDVSGGIAGTANGAVTAVAYASSPSTTSSSNAQVSLGDGGEGGAGGTVTLTGNNISTGAISLASMPGANGGGAGSASATVSGPLGTSSVIFGSGGNVGGISPNLTVTGTGTVALGAINASRGSGGNGADASGSNGYGGSGGSSNSGAISTIDISGASVSTGTISARGGDGGNGGATTAAVGTGGPGADGGYGGIVIVTSTTTTSTGTIDVSGGRGGRGGSAASGYGGIGGNGGYGGYVLLDPNTLSTGAILAAGGAAGAGGSGGIFGAAGGVGGYGGFVAGNALTAGQTIVYGAITMGNVDVSGGTGGAGGSTGTTGFYGGAGGAGGYGGSIDVFGGSINMLAGGAVSASGGAGGAGGSGVGAYGGNGGNGGSGGLLALQSLSALGYAGTITVPATLAYGAFGGTGGAGGTTGGLSGTTGVDGSSVVEGTIVASGFVGDLRLEGNGVIQGTNQLAQTNNAPSTDDLQKKNDENKKKNQAAACK